MTVKRENLIQIEDKLYQKCKVHLLPTDKEGKLRLNNNGKLSFEPHIKGLSYDGLIHTYQHLYITSDEKIEEGDWMFHKLDKHPIKFDGDNSGRFPYGYKKIISSTDKSLNLPQPSQEFIEVFIREWNKDNKIEDVLVEYELNIPENANKFPHFKVEVVRCVWEEDYRLKINPKDNTITIRKVKDSWSREEVISLIKKYSKEACGQPWFDTDDKWIEENL